MLLVERLNWIFTLEHMSGSGVFVVERVADGVAGLVSVGTGVMVAATSNVGDTSLVGLTIVDDSCAAVSVFKGAGFVRVGLTNEADWKEVVKT